METSIYKCRQPMRAAQRASRRPRRCLKNTTALKGPGNKARGNAPGKEAQELGAPQGRGNLPAGEWLSRPVRAGDFLAVTRGCAPVVACPGLCCLAPLGPKPGFFKHGPGWWAALPGRWRPLLRIHEPCPCSMGWGPVRPFLERLMRKLQQPQRGEMR